MDNKVLYLLVGLSLIVAFMGGSLWTRFLVADQKKPEAQVVEVASPQPEAAVPQQPEVLGEEDMAAIVKDPAASKGPEDAPVTIVEFSEYQCPYCKKYIDESYVKILEEYGDEVRYIFRDYPLGFHQHAQKAAEAARCAGDQGKYWEYHDKLFEEQETWTAGSDATDLLVGYAGELGLDKEEFNSCLTEGKFADGIKSDFELGQKVGVSGTPSFFVNGKFLVGAQPYEVFKRAIEGELE